MVPEGGPSLELAFQAGGKKKIKKQKKGVVGLFRILKTQPRFQKEWEECSNGQFLHHRHAWIFAKVRKPFMDAGLGGSSVFANTIVNTN